MKIFRLAVLLSIFSLSFIGAIAQSAKETFAVPGNCGMCKSKIEAAAKGAGATYAYWDEEAKILSLVQKGGKPGSTKIQEAVAAAGYDTPEMKASTEAYNKLHACCKYERGASKDDNPDKSLCVNEAGDHAVCSNCAQQLECCMDKKCELAAIKNSDSTLTQKVCCKQS